MHVDRIVEAAAELKARITLILVTHHHVDHLPGALRLRRKTGAPSPHTSESATLTAS